MAPAHPKRPKTPPVYIVTPAGARAERAAERGASLDALPEALRKLLIKVRKGLKEKGDDGTQDGKRAYVSVPVGWAEVRAVYALHTALGAARDARESWKTKTRKTARVLEKTTLQTRADLEQLDLLNNRAIIALLVDVHSILSGDDVPEMQVHATRERVRALIDRSQGKDKRRRVRQ